MTLPVMSENNPLAIIYPGANMQQCCDTAIQVKFLTTLKVIFATEICFMCDKI